MSDCPRRFSAPTMRRIWFVAAVECVHRGRLRDALEAFINTSRRVPPLTWTTGAGIIDLKPTVIE